MTASNVLPDRGACGALLDVTVVAQMLGCSPTHVRRLSNTRKMPAPVRLGDLVRWRRQSLEEWIAGGCKPYDGEAADER